MVGTNKIADIYNSYIDELYTYALYLGFEKEDIMDAIHDVFCKLSEEKETLDRVTNIKFYLLRSLRNRLLDIYQSKQKITEINTDIEKYNEIQFNFHLNFDDEIVGREEKELIKERIEKILASLTNKQREIIYLRYIQEYDYPQIAEILNISIHGCRKLVSKAILRLREKNMMFWITLLHIFLSLKH